VAFRVTLGRNEKMAGSRVGRALFEVSVSENESLSALHGFELIRVVSIVAPDVLRAHPLPEILLSNCVDIIRAPGTSAFDS
jgi:hypothetical protein